MRSAGDADEPEDVADSPSAPPSASAGSGAAATQAPYSAQPACWRARNTSRASGSVAPHASHDAIDRIGVAERVQLAEPDAGRRGGIEGGVPGVGHVRTVTKTGPDARVSARPRGVSLSGSTPLRDSRPSCGAALFDQRGPEGFGGLVEFRRVRFRQRREESIPRAARRPSGQPPRGSPAVYASRTTSFLPYVEFRPSRREIDY